MKKNEEAVMNGLSREIGNNRYMTQNEDSQKKKGDEQHELLNKTKPKQSLAKNKQTNKNEKKPNKTKTRCCRVLATSKQLPFRVTHIQVTKSGKILFYLLILSLFALSRLTILYYIILQ